MRRQSNDKYKQPATWVDKYAKEHFFRCYTDERKEITTPMGNSVQLKDGQMFLETDADFNFEHEDGIMIDGYDELSISKIVSRVPVKNDNNAYRGNPVYVTKMIIN
jgi:hypothetical protein